MTCVATDSKDTGEIIVPLVQVTVWKTSGATVSPGNKDLPCLVNGETLMSEANLLPGGIFDSHKNVCNIFSVTLGPEGRLGTSDVSLLSGISELSLDSTFL